MRLCSDFLSLPFFHVLSIHFPPKVVGFNLSLEHIFMFLFASMFAWVFTYFLCVFTVFLVC